jgi:CRP-like cAMP-binding protein
LEEAAKFMARYTMHPPLNCSSRPDNRILAALPDEEYQCLLPHLRQIRLHEGDVLNEVGEAVERVYFLTQGIASLTLICAQGMEVELSVVGNEGMVGVRAVMGGGITIIRATVLLAGSAWVMPASVLRAEFQKTGVLADLLLRQIEGRLMETSQTALCNHLHRIDQRLSRWILTIADRVHREQLYLTQEQIARMLAVRRSGVTEAVGVLRAAGLIDHQRACITILDRRGMEEQTCPCYQAIKEAVRLSLPPK